jgi:hypothetical protein
VRKAKHRREVFPKECRTKGHDWKKNGWTGKQNHNWDEKPYRAHIEETQHYNCSRKCGSHKYELLNWDREFSREERMVEILRYTKSLQAMVWFLDNVQPAYSSEGDGYEQEGANRWHENQVRT